MSDSMPAAQDWNVLVGNWVGAELEVGAAYEGEVVETVPLFGGVDLPMVYEFGATGYVACNEADAEESCVELLMSSEAKPEAASALIGKILGAMDQGLADSMADARLTIVNYAALVTHARTLNRRSTPMGGGHAHDALGH